MRVLGVVVASVLLAAVAQGQMVVAGASGGVTWEINPDTRPDDNWLQNNSIAPSVFVGVPIMGDTLMRLRAFDLPREQAVGESVVDSRLRGVTVGVDYLMVSLFGKTVFSGGLGSYQLDIEGSSPELADLESWDFGWFVGIGEWIPMTRNSHITFDLTYHSTSHPGRPQLLSAAVGLAFYF